ncbi:249_t:CDS:2 [Paraglomus brasilianum]|uniref:249_t:CDS:1 n=1 Tax=Paraglomus brasilianum TaxID=144538 RepID=A0A9N9A1E8_9GLOM|nr:249_t:CDS:2 [Paraglomus brasilianum]
MSNPPKEGTSEWDQWCSQGNNADNNVTTRPTSANPLPTGSPSKTQNPTEGISSSSVIPSTVTSAALASNTVSANLSSNQTSSTISATFDAGNVDSQAASNPAAKAMKFWIPLIGVIVLVLIVFTIASCLGYQFVRRRKLKRQIKLATLGSLEKGSTDDELLNHCSSAGEVVSSQTDSSPRSSSDNIENPLSVDNVFSGKITVDALTSTMYYNGQVVPPIGTRIIPPEDQIRLDINETQPEEVRYNSRSLVFPET